MALINALHESINKYKRQGTFINEIFLSIEDFDILKKECQGSIFVDKESNEYIYDYALLLKIQKSNNIPSGHFAIEVSILDELLTDNEREVKEIIE